MFYEKDFIFTSESVSEGHPDKICDQISDGILDLYLQNDPASRVACECLVTTNYLLIAGEISSKAKIQSQTIEETARNIICKIGYDKDDVGFNFKSAKVEIKMHEQSNDIAQGVEGKGFYQEQGAGDQGMMFGFAINETDNLMPMPIQYSHKILQTLSKLRHENTVSFLLPDAKSQVSVKYEKGIPIEITKIVVSTQHREDVSYEDIKEFVIEECIKKCIQASWLKNTKYFINPTGRFVIGGPKGDCGLTGRKIIVDTYGGFARHGGGAFSGKDPSKVDRSAAYMARYLAKNLVAAKMADICEIQLAYAIGVAKPISVMVNTFGTGKISDQKLEGIIKDNFNLTPINIRETLSLNNIHYLPTSAYGHFGRQENGTFTWEATDKINVFKG